MAVKICWITGASSGIGKELAIQLAREGYIVAASARSVDKLQQLAAVSYGTGQIIPYPLDVTDLAAVMKTAKAIVDAFGAIHLAVLCAGTYIQDSALHFESASIQTQWMLNVMGTVHALEVLLSLMKNQSGAQIGVISSVAGYRGLPYAAGYGGTKAALINMVESLRPQCQMLGIKLQLICPGFVKTPLTDKNSFPMPFLISAEQAAQSIIKGLSGNSFEIVFPLPMKISMKLLRLLPYRLFFMVTKKMLRS